MAATSSEVLPEVNDGSADALTEAVVTGLFSSPKTLPAWLLYDAVGSELFERITELPEYYLTRLETALLAEHAASIVSAAAGDRRLAIAELGAGTAKKTSLLLAAVVEAQGSAHYQPLDVSNEALEVACESLKRLVPQVDVHPHKLNYVIDPIAFHRDESRVRDEGRVMAVYIGSSIGNFTPIEAEQILKKVRAALTDGDCLLLGTDLAPGVTKPIAELLDAYDDAAGVTAKFNLNLLHRINREMGTDFEVSAFQHVARWNQTESRIEMHLEALNAISVTLPAALVGERRSTVSFQRRETIHTENSYKFELRDLDRLFHSAGFSCEYRVCDPQKRYALSLARVLPGHPTLSKNERD